MKLTSILSAGFLALLASSASASVIVIDNTTHGYYNAGLGNLADDPVLGAQTDTVTGLPLFPGVGDPLIPMAATEPNLAGSSAATQAALGNFLGNTTALGGAWSSAPQAIPSSWVVEAETAIVYVIEAGAGIDDVTVRIGVDNGFFAWLNGTYLTGALAPGGAFVGEYVFDLGDLTGTNYLQILREDHGGLTGWTIEATGTPVPEPTSLLMLGMGLAGAAALRRRRSA